MAFSGVLSEQIGNGGPYRRRPFRATAASEHRLGFNVEATQPAALTMRCADLAPTRMFREMSDAYRVAARTVSPLENSVK